MKRWQDPAEQTTSRRQRKGDRRAAGSADQPGAGPPSPQQRPASQGQHLWPPPAAPVNPPWESESVKMPATPASRLGGGDDESFEWDSAFDQSSPWNNLNDLTGTGRLAAVVPLTPNSSGWGKGLRVPADGSGAALTPPGASAAALGVPGGMGVELDDQSSVQMRALRAGNLARATLIVSGALLVSRVLGLLRTSLFAYTFGGQSTLTQADAFTNAFALPDMLFTIVAGGALASAFIPVFADYLIDKRDKRTAWHIASSALNLSMLVLTLLGIVGFIFAPQFLDITLHPYFTNGNPEGPLIVEYTRIMLLQPIFLGGATIAVAILQARQHFMLPAMGQVIYTVSLIGGIAATLIDRRTGIFGGHLEMLGPVYGVVAGAALQFLIQIPGLARARMQYGLSFDFWHPGIREMFRLMVPRILNAALIFVSLYINRDLLGLLNQKGIVYGYVTAFTLVMLPVGVFGMAVAQAGFPTLAALVAAGEWQRLRDTVMRTVRGVMFLALPSALGLIVLADPITRLLLAHGSFDLSVLPYFSQPLIFFSIGLVGLALVEVLTRSFYALHDTRTATEVSILQFLFVIGMSVLLLHPMSSSGLALATALGSNGEALVLLLLLRPRLGGLDLRQLGVFTLNVLAASVVTALAALFVYTLAKTLLPGVGTTSVTETLRMTVRVGAAIAVAAAVYFGFSRFLGTDDVVSLQRIAGRFFRRH
ncbi:MAG TPA: murein biosynthesis integral membrane protein MurJ [Ktedonobacterales bacterium]